MEKPKVKDLLGKAEPTEYVQPAKYAKAGHAHPEPVTPRLRLCMSGLEESDEIFKVSSKLMEMLNALPKKNERVFGSSLRSTKKKVFFLQRRRTAEKLKNPRLLKITFHTFRHWKATMLYHQTKDIIRVQRFLGLKKIENTMLYIQIAENLFKETSDGFAVKVATKPNEIKGLLEVGFEYVCQRDGLVFFRKRK